MFCNKKKILYLFSNFIFEVWNIIDYFSQNYRVFFTRFLEHFNLSYSNLKAFFSKMTSYPIYPYIIWWINERFNIIVSMRNIQHQESFPVKQHFGRRLIEVFIIVVPEMSPAVTHWDFQKLSARFNQE